MIEIKFKQEEQLLNDIQDEFNILCTAHYPEILEKSHYELWILSGKKYNAQDWKAFRMDTRVDAWYTQELILIAKHKAIKLINKAGDNKSVGETQALAQTLTYIDKHEKRLTDDTKIIYCFIPLNQNELEADNVKIINNIPTEIKDALINIKGDPNRE